jgi:hypothetical protein
MPKGKQRKNNKKKGKQAAKPRKAVPRPPRPVDSALVRIKAVMSMPAVASSGSVLQVAVDNRVMGTYAAGYVESPLHALSQLFQQVRIHRLSMRYLSSLPATSGGQVALGLDRDGTATAYVATDAGFNKLIMLSGTKDSHAINSITLPYKKEPFNTNFISCDLNGGYSRPFNLNAEHTIAMVRNAADGVIPGMLEIDGVFEFKGLRASGA